MSANTPARNATAVLGDVSALYQVSMSVQKESHVPVQLNYSVLKEAVVGHFGMGNPKDQITFWSGSDSSNLGQQRLFELLERQKIAVRRFAPRDSYICEPEKLGLDPTRDAQHRLLLLQRFSGSIAFAAGALCNRYRIIFISDSFQLAEPLVRASELARKRKEAPAGLVFWKTHLDPRWHQIIDQFGIDFLDLDPMQDQLFRPKGEHAGKPRQSRQGFDDGFLLDKD